MVKKQNKQNKRVRRAMVSYSRSERKLYDLYAAAALTTAFTIYPLSPFPQGTSYNERIGLSTNLHRLEINFVFRSGTALLGSTVANVRVMIFTDLQQIDSSSPTGLELLSIASPLSAINWFNISRFKIHYDQNVTLDVYHTQLKKILNKNIGGTIKFSGSSGANITRNGLYILFITDNAINNPSVEMWSRTIFSDP